MVPEVWGTGFCCVHDPWDGRGGNLTLLFLPWHRLFVVQMEEVLGKGAHCLVFRLIFTPPVVRRGNTLLGLGSGQYATGHLGQRTHAPRVTSKRRDIGLNWELPSWILVG